MTTTIDNDNGEYSHLPTEYYGGKTVRNYQGFWYRDYILPGVIRIHDEGSSNHFTPHPTDIILASFPKSGTTWLKALAFSIVNRAHHPPADPNHPLLTSLHAQDSALFLEGWLSANRAPSGLLESLPSPRLLATHLPYQLLPEPMLVNSTPKIIYICRDPKDAVVSMWHFIHAASSSEVDLSPPPPIEDEFEQCCKGVVPFGPMWDHWLGYWKESLKRPEKVMFMRYEEVMEDGVGSVRRVAEFLGCPLTSDEEEKPRGGGGGGGGVAEEIVRLCSFEKLSGAGVSKTGVRGIKGRFETANSSYYRKGRIGDWVNYLTPEMGKRLDDIVQQKLHGSGLNFK